MLIWCFGCFHDYMNYVHCHIHSSLLIELQTSFATMLNISCRFIFYYKFYFDSFLSFYSSLLLLLHHLIRGDCSVGVLVVSMILEILFIVTFIVLYLLNINNIIWILVESILSVHIQVEFLLWFFSLFLLFSSSAFSSFNS